MLTEMEILKRLAIAAVLGAAVGFEREWLHKYNHYDYLEETGEKIDKEEVN